MVVVEDPNGKKYSLDGYLYRSFSFAKEVMDKKDVDLPILISGYPGTGKSTLTMQIATFIDPTFTEKRMCVDVPSFLNQIKKADNRTAIVLDEAFEHLNTAEIRREMGRALSNMLNVIRQKNLYIFIIIPNFFDMGKPIAIFRTRWLIHCYEVEFGDIGRFLLFDRNTKHKLYIKGKKSDDYDCVRADFHGRFTKFIPTQINYEIYLKKKAEGMQNIFSRRDTSTKTKAQRDKGMVYMKKILDYKIEKISEIFGVSIRTVFRIIKDSTDKEEEEKLVKTGINKALKDEEIKKGISVGIK